MNIYVGNLGFKVEDEDLKEVFKEYGEVTSARVMKDKFTGRSKGFGFVEMANEEEAKNAISKLNGVEMEGRPMTVNPARPKTETGRRNRY